jgi:hypothetical protein
MMSKKQLFLVLTSIITSSFIGQSYADQAGDLTKDCAQRQLEAHKGLKKSLTESDFQPYCSCVSKTIAESLTASQLNELKANGANKNPEWFLEAQKSAEKMCFAGKPKFTT